MTTPEALWAEILTIWQKCNLPTPVEISLTHNAVTLPNNERGQVAAWAHALGCGPAHLGSVDPHPSGRPRTTTDFTAHVYPYRRDAWWVMCNVDLDVDAEAHGWTSQSPLDAVSAMIGHLTEDDEDPRAYQDGSEEQILAQMRQERHAAEAGAER